MLNRRINSWRASIACAWIHSAEDFFPALTIHCCELAHQLVARLPFCVFGSANAEREQRGDDPNGNVGRGNKKHEKR